MLSEGSRLNSPMPGAKKALTTKVAARPSLLGGVVPGGCPVQLHRNVSFIGAGSGWSPILKVASGSHQAGVMPDQGHLLSPWDCAGWAPAHQQQRRGSLTLQGSITICEYSAGP